MSFWKWVRTAASNALADSTCPWPEGMDPAQINDSARGMMAAAAKYRDDIAGAIVTGGTSTAYTVSSYQVFDSLTHLDGAMLAFTPHATSGAAPTLSVDTMTAKPIRAVPGADLLPGVLIQGTPYAVTYNNTDGVFYLRGLFGNPYNVPLAAGMDYWGSTAPNSAFAFPTGQAISRTTYASLFALIGTTYGVGDGTTTFNLPDKTGRISAMKEAAASRLTATYFGGNSANLGAVGGLESNNVLITHTHVNTLNDPGHSHIGVHVATGQNAGGADVNVGTGSHSIDDAVRSNTTGITLTNASAGSAAAHNIVQPTIVCNYIIRVL
jgi:microcystin-dependent protein